MHAELVFAEKAAGGPANPVPEDVMVLDGQPERVRAARAWVRDRAEAAGTDPGEAELLAGELVANAVVHTRSGRPGGLLSVAVVPGGGGVVLHVHDEGTAAGPRPGGEPDGGLRESGRGMLIVGALTAESGFGPAARCGVFPVPATGRCTWALMPAPARAGDPSVLRPSSAAALAGGSR